MSKQQKSNPDCELEPIKTKLPLGLKKAVTEAAVSGICLELKVAFYVN